MNDQRDATPPISQEAAPERTAKNPKNPQISPTLTAYFGPKPIAAAAFAKALKAAKIQRFSSEEISEAARAVLELEDSATRLLQLATQPGKPKAIDRWIWQSIQTFLRTKIPAAFDSVDCDADATFRQIHRELRRCIDDADPKRRQQAETLLALSLAWLASQRSLNVVATIEQLRDIFTTSEASAKEAARKALAEGKMGTLRKVAAVAHLLESALRDARSTFDRERQSRTAIEAQLQDAQVKSSELAAKIETLTEQLNSAKAETAEAVRKLNASQQHAAHDIVGVKSRNRTFLERRLTPLLTDARDALEIDPPATNVSLRRIKSAIDAIGEENK